MNECERGSGGLVGHSGRPRKKQNKKEDQGLAAWPERNPVFARFAVHAGAPLAHQRQASLLHCASRVKRTPRRRRMGDPRLSGTGPTAMSARPCRYIRGLKCVPRALSFLSPASLIPSSTTHHSLSWVANRLNAVFPSSLSFPHGARCAEVRARKFPLGSVSLPNTPSSLWRPSRSDFGGLGCRTRSGASRGCRWRRCARMGKLTELG